MTHTPAPPRNPVTLRTGWTTGACAIAAACAAYSAILSQRFSDSVEILLPNGQRPRFPLARACLHADGSAEAGVVKDAGDDPDVTHGLEIIATVRPLPPGAGLCLRGGIGVGTITRPGLPLPPGEPAINPGPRSMLAHNLTAIAEAHGVKVDLEVEIAIPGGDRVAEKTMNGRLGILGGLSVLGTTGVVLPYSCSAWVASLHQAVDVARAAGLDHLAATTGKTSETGLLKLYPLPAMAIIDMGDFAAGLLKYFRRHPIRCLTIAGGIAKLAKLAAGHGDLHSSRSQLDKTWMASLLPPLGATPAQCAEAGTMETAMALLDYAETNGWPLAREIALRARTTALSLCDHRIEIEILVFDRQGILKGRS